MSRMSAYLVLALFCLLPFQVQKVVAGSPERPAITNTQSGQVGLFLRPTQTDIALIKTAAELGAPQKVAFPANANVAQFIAKKCGQPSTTILVHPTYEAVLLKNNPGLTSEELVSLPSKRTILIPACAVFAERPATFETPLGVGEAASIRGVPFNTHAFRKIVTNRVLREELQRDFKVANSTGPTTTFRTASIITCGMSLYPQLLGAMTSPDAIRRYYACVNAIEIVSANPNIQDPDIFTGKVTIPAAAKVTEPELKFDRVPLKASPTIKSDVVYASVEDIRRVESPLQFVPAVRNVDAYGKGCTDAAKIQHGKWPFDVPELIRALSFHDGASTDTPGGILVVDTGFDFAGDSGKLPSEEIQLVFPQIYIHRTERNADTSESGSVEDRNEDTVPDNGGWAGVNLASARGSTSAETSVLDGNRSHGLSVVTLALGGRNLERVRRIARLPIIVGFASLVPLDTSNPRIDQGHVERSLIYATAAGNNFNVINFSLSSKEKFSGLKSILERRGLEKVIVVAAGNDGKQLVGNDRVWPASLGGKASTDYNRSAVIITVGAHDGNYKLAEFSNRGNSVDIIAPGCMVPSYELDTSSDTLGLVPSYVTGTSFAAPLVSFVAGLLSNSPEFSRRPGLIKSRIQTSANFDPDLIGAAYSAGTLNAAKALGFRYDILEVDNGNGGRRLRYGKILNKDELDELKCNAEDVTFRWIKKIARHPNWERVLVFWNSDDDIPSKIERQFCEQEFLNGIVYEFADIEVRRKFTINATDVWDYVARR